MTYGYNSRYLTKDGKPWFPVMGEIHYSRYQDSLWEESLRQYLQFMADHNVSPEELQSMTKTTPTQLLGLTDILE